MYWFYIVVYLFYSICSFNMGFIFCVCLWEFISVLFFMYMCLIVYVDFIIDIEFRFG